MKEFTYPYRIIRGISSPIIPVKITKDDSGATYSVFSADEAEKLDCSIAFWKLC